MAGQRGMVIRSGEFWGGLFWLAVSAFAVWAGQDLGLGRLSDPGSGFLLFNLGCIMAGLSTIVLLGALRAPGESVAMLWHQTRWRKVLTVVVLLLAYGVLFERLGFIICSVAMLLVLMLLIDPVNVRVAVPLALLAPVGVWYVITRWLKIQLPAGLLAGWPG